jgi:hypothetical protein
LTKGLAGVGIWALEYDRGFPELWNVLRSKFYAPIHELRPSGRVASVVRRAGFVTVGITARVRNYGSVPERGGLRWGIKDSRGRWIAKGSWTIRVQPGTLITRYARARIGAASRLPAGTYQLVIRFQNANGLWSSGFYKFRQPY